jgi:hypothetical protein
MTALARFAAAAHKVTNVSGKINFRNLNVITRSKYELEAFRARV